jgi:hypothetical protein
VRVSYDDDTFGTIFPRRTGVPTGHANERAMLDGLGGSEGFRKRFRDNVDGSVTRLDTKNGQPQFSNSGAPTQAARTDIYMESGQLDWNYPAPEAFDRLDPAKWHFRDIPTDNPFLGRIVSETGAQKNAAPLVDDQDSLAIGYPHSADTGIDATTKEAYGNATLLKKFTAGFFAPSIYSGKMRLFLQAQYGAAETKAVAPLRVDVSGDSPVLTYVRNEVTLNFGVWAHSSPGIFTDDNGYFWLAIIANPTGSEYGVTVYPITAGNSVKGLATYLRANRATLDAATIAKLEAYIFAGSVIETARPSAVGTFPAPAGGALVYGWKWNSTGSEASIVVHELLGTGAADYRWKARTIQITLTSTGGGSAQTFTLGHTVEAGAEWTDGWGTFNIFLPDSETASAPLSLFSLKLDTGTYLPDFDFTNVPVYGYYIGDVWKPVKISRTVLAGPFPMHLWSSSNITYPTSMDPAVYSANRFTHGNVPADESCSYNEVNISAGTTMSVQVEDVTYPGTAYTCTRVDFTRDTVLTGATSDNGVAFTTYAVGGNASTLSPLPGYTGGTGGPDGANHGGFVKVAKATIVTRNMTGQQFEAWVLVIPGGDCEAAYVSTHTYDNPTSYSNTTRIAYGVGEFFSTVGGYDFEIWCDPSAGSDFFGSVGIVDVVTTDTGPPATKATHVYCFNKPVHGTEGTPGGSYTSLFNVSRDYPFYDRGMYTYTSNGQRYIMSEGLKSPASVTTARFVGWA